MRVVYRFYRTVNRSAMRLRREPFGLGEASQTIASPLEERPPKAHSGTVHRPWLPLRAWHRYSLACVTVISPETVPTLIRAGLVPAPSVSFTETIPDARITFSVAPETPPSLAGAG